MVSSTSACVMVVVALVALQLVDCYYEGAAMLNDLTIAEAHSERSDGLWQQGLSSEDPVSLREALQGYQMTLERAALAKQPTVDSVATALSGAFAVFLARPLRLHCMHRVAAIRELLRQDSALIAHAHQQLLDDGYCTDLLEGFTSRRQWHYEACIAPIARGTIQFAAGKAEADAAFDLALQLAGVTAVAPALSWTSRLQLPDHHTAGLAAKPWWPQLAAVAALETSSKMLLAEFKRVFATEGGGDAFARRRADSWIADPQLGWGMLPIVREGRCIAPQTCSFVQQLRSAPRARGSSKDDLSGVGYYLLRPGAWLHLHAAPSNKRLTCHLTLEGEGALFTVGGEPKEWIVGKAFCFDDSFLHEAVHRGTADRYILLIDIPHPDLDSNQM